jgi:hypothetical protein
MDHRRAASRRARAVACATAFSLWATAATSATDGASGFAIRQSLVSNGGGFVNDNCYRLRSAIGQPVLGVVGNAEFTLASGFLAETASTDDKLFRSGFETSTGICK